ncbi:glycoside hydrolase superfamily [Hyaloscypha finlandica]|nr:glycoside hydrolase superfamily [Hyaloscypha finlandica]KAH8757140.1 glycoside hydrolase superfamily [Hyaloscypha sp. PMI_1271]
MLTKQIRSTYLEPNLALYARNSYVYREGTSLKLLGEPWTAEGANVYWLGLDENVIPPKGEPFYAPLNASYPTKGRTTEVMNTLVMMGATLMRVHTLGVSVGNPLSLSPSLGVYNDAAFEPMDWAVFQARQHGLRIMVPLTDNYDYYHGGKFTFLRWAGYNITGSQSPLPPETMYFYTSPKVVTYFKNYIHYLLTHVNPYTGLSYAEDPTIIGYETGNELDGGKFKDQNVPIAWIREICRFVKKLGPKKLCIDGTYGVNSTHFAVSEVDIFSNHYYPLNNSILTADIAAVRSANRVYLAGEIAWTGMKGDSLQSFYDIILKQQNSNSPVVAGSQIWSLFGHNVPYCSTYINHTDGYSLMYGNPNNSAKIDAQISTIRQHYFAMQNITVDSYLPAVACPQNYIPGYDAEYTYM